MIAHLSVFDWSLITPKDVGGTFMGGAMDVLAYLMGWAVVTFGLLTAIVCRLPGSIFGWISAGLITLLIGAWWQLNYPDSTGDVMYSISEHEIGSIMIIGVIVLSSGLYARDQLKARPPSPNPAPWKIIIAALLVAFFMGVPLAIHILSRQPPLPYCAFNKTGQQLSICLDHNRVIID